MARLLYRLGRWSARRAWLVIVGWLAVLGLGGGAFLLFGGTLTSSFSIPGTPTERITEQLKTELPDYAGAAATLVFQAQDGAFDDTQRAAIGDLLAEISDVDGVAQVVDPFDTEAQLADRVQQLEDGRTQLADGEAQLEDGQAQLDAAAQQLADGQAQLDAAIAEAQAAGVYDFARAELDAQQAQLDAGAEQLASGREQLESSRAELTDAREQLDLGQRLLDASSAVHMVSEDGATALGTVVFENDFFTLTDAQKADVSALLDAADIDGVAIDYSSEITASLNGIIGVGEIVGVALALVVLLVMLRAILPALLPIITSTIGVGAGIAIGMSFSGIVSMSSVTPALGLMIGLAVGIDYALFIINRHRHELAHGVELRESIGLANGTAGSAVVFAGATVAVALLGLTVTGIPFLVTMGIVAAFCVLVAVLIAVTLVPAILRLIGRLALDRGSRRRWEGRPRPAPKPMRTWQAIVAVVAGVVALLVIATPLLSMRLALLNAASEAQDSTQYRAYHLVNEEFGPGRNSALLIVAGFDEPVAEADELALQADLADFLMAQDHVAAAVPVGISEDRELVAFQVVPDTGPTSAETEQLIDALRNADPPAGAATLGVAGSASAAMDISAKLADALPLYLAIIVVIAIILLIVVFRSILVPIVATLGFVLSLFAALGAVTAVYQWGWLGQVFDVHDPGPVLAFAPILIIGILFGLAMDYQLFLVTGMREAYVHGTPARTAVVAGLRSGRAVVTAAAIIMAAVFGGFVFSHLGMIRPLGFGLAIGVLFDAFVVRMLIVPGLMHLLGRSAWWIPRWLDRILPNVDVEGAALERQTAAPAPDRAPRDRAGIDEGSTARLG